MSKDCFDDSCCGGSGSCGCASTGFSMNSYSADYKEYLKKLKTRSKKLTSAPGEEDWMKRSAARAMMRAVGYEDADFEKPLVCIAAPYTDITPCNFHIKELGETIHAEVSRIGGKPYIFGTPVVTDGQSMGMDGMKYSLPSRELIADSIETMYNAYSADALITISGCDKTIPATLMPLARDNAIGLTLYGGSILPGKHKGKANLDIVSIFEAIGARSAGKIDDKEFHEIECKSCPTSGSCGGMYTANTMATAIEAMGMSLPGSSSNPATNYSKRVSEEKYMDCINTARAVFNLMEKGIRARDIMTKKAFENAMTVMMALTGSTNGVLHLIALAREAEVDLKLEDFQRINDQTPILADLKPSGKYVMYDLYKAGGLQVVMKELLKNDLIHGDCLTVNGQTIEQNLKDVEDMPTSQDVIYSFAKPKEGKGKHLAILRGNLAPDGAVIKLSGKYLSEGDRKITCKAKVFNSEIEANDAILNDKIEKGDIVVIRYEGPRGGPGMQEMLAPTSALAGRGLIHDVPLITDGRFSGGSHGMIVGHITPEAFDGGPIAIVEEGDMITIDAKNNELNVEIPKEEIERRLAKWKQPEPRFKRGYLAKYAKTVSTASEGAVTS
jgi:dihydroxy-acid dehydratase